MKRRDPELEPELEAFLAHRPIERRVPPGLRARVLARGRLIAAAGGAIPPAPLERSLSVPAMRGRHSVRIAVAASIAVAAAAAGAVAALHVRSAPAPQMIAPPSVSVPPTPPVEPAVPRAEPAPAAARPHPGRTAPKGDPFAAELELLQRAHTAYTRRDFSVALALVAEHARRFPRGRLAEQREALRVRSLAGAGRADDARRAAAEFAAQFPRSVLLPRVAGSPASAEP
jgi:hypothetical protein